MTLAMQSVVGILVLTGFAWTISEHRRHVSLWTIVIGLGLQFLIAVILLKTPGSREFFVSLNGIVLAIEQATKAGTSLVFGYVGGAPLPFSEPYPGAGFILAFQALPIVIVMSAISSLLFHWRILPLVVAGFSWALQRTLRIGGAVGVATAANIFVGMVEAPLLVRPYLARLSRSEIFIVMTAGMATVAGTVLVLYASLVSQHIEGALGHLLTASLISAPAAIMVARILVPASSSEPGVGIDAETATETPDTMAGALMPRETLTAMDAITQGTVNGLRLFLNIVAMLLVFVALVSLANQLIALLPLPGAGSDGAALTLERILGWIMAPVTWLIGIPWDQATTAGSLMGTKTVLNEFLAYLQLAKLPPGALDDRSRLIMIYALCGFANFGSLGIMIGGLTTMVPERRKEIVGLGLKSILSGTLATLLTGAVVGALTW